MPNKSHPIFDVYFWQRIVTPHMANLAEALGAQGHAVTYVANKSLSPDREQMGWIAPVLKQAQLCIAANANEVTQVVLNVPAESIHICQGLRGNGLVSIAQQELAKRRVRQWVIMETVDDAGFFGLLRWAMYRWLFMRRQKTLQGVLAIGWKTSDWLITCGVPQNRIFPFAYFLSDAISSVKRTREGGRPFRFMFVGQLIERKRVDHLIQALAKCLAYDFEFVIVGDGPMRTRWEAIASEVLPNRVRWEGRISMDEVPQQLANADCLVLPSRHDGWGAVVSEALMVGTTVVCSDACGSSGIVSESGFGGVFSSEDRDSLVFLLQQMLKRGALSRDQRQEVVAWAKSLGAESSARYLCDILAYPNEHMKRPQVPWQCEN
ncbi:glycosyltransferase family 4 protein [Litoricolaceae bacterium]|nr:glycosyltransferase family 4 protein [Litorivicinaceae bacterium]